jgi:hypothetical protein
LFGLHNRQLSHRIARQSTLFKQFLRLIAEMRGGEFFSATSAAELQLVFQKLHKHIALTNQTIEISVYFAATGAILAMAALILSFFWHLLF